MTHMCLICRSCAPTIVIYRSHSLMLVHHLCIKQSYLCSGLTKLGSPEGVSSFMLPRDCIIVDFFREMWISW